MHSFRRQLSFAFPLLAFALAGTAAEHPVDSVAELDAALGRVRPGDVITLRSGEWKDADLLFRANGSPGNPVTLQAAQPGKTILTGRTRLRIAGQHLIVSGLFFHGAWHKEDLIQFRGDSKTLSTDCRLTQCAVVDCNAPGTTATTRWVGMYGQRNRVDHCWLEGKTTLGTTLVVWLGSEPADHRIDHNYFGHRPYLGQNGGETIRVGDSKTSMQRSNTVVEANCFERCDGEAEIISNKSCGNIYRGNTFLRCAGSLTLRHGNDCLVEGNFFLGMQVKGSGGVRIIGERHRVEGNYFQDLAGLEARAALCLVNGQANAPLNGYFQVRDAQITGNTWVNCRQPVYLGQSDEDSDNSLPPQRVVFSRNLISGTTPALVTAAPGDLAWNDNLVIPSAAPNPPIPGLRPAEFPFEARPDGIRLPSEGSSASGYGFHHRSAPLLPPQTGPEWRTGSE